MAEIRDASGVSLRRLYGLYPSKHDLVAAWLEARHTSWMRWFQAGVETRIGGGASPVDALFDTLAEWASTPGYRGCAFLNTAAEVAEIDDRHLQIIAAHKRDLVGYLTELMRDAVPASPSRSPSRSESSSTERSCKRRSSARSIRSTRRTLPPRDSPDAAGAGVIRRASRSSPLRASSSSSRRVRPANSHTRPRWRLAGSRPLAPATASTAAGGWRYTRNERRRIHWKKLMTANPNRIHTTWRGNVRASSRLACLAASPTSVS